MKDRVGCPSARSLTAVSTHIISGKKKTLGDIDDILPKKPGDEIFDAVAEDLDEDHQKYIN